MISLRLNENTEKLREEFTLWLRDHRPPQLSERVELAEFVRVSSAWQQTLAKDRWVGVHWPIEYGGRGLTLVEEAVIQEKLAEVNAPQLVNLFGLTMVGPVLIKHGRDEQKKRFLPKILSAEEIWCQGFSEPEAGSDLAALRTSAVKQKSKQGSNWCINGQKIWTSFAQYAQWCFLLIRTDNTVAKHKGLSYLLVPMTASGIDVRPLTQISGDQEFNEIFFDNVCTAEENIVGAPGDGWKIAISTLMYERVILTFARHLQSEGALRDIAEVFRSRKPNSLELMRYGRLLAKSMAVRALALSHLVGYSEQVSPGPEGSLDKLFWSETFQEICQFALEILGPAAVLTSGVGCVQNGLHQHRYLYSRGRTIAAGTSEIQRNIIAERVLGLPRE